MREIKFRGLNSQSDWEYGTYYIGVMYPTSFEGHYIGDKLVDENTIGQFTGLKDKNGNQIFDGDILKDSSGYTWKVFWINDHACFGIISVHNNVVIEIIDNINMEVIGNVHQNPELLNN